MKQRFKYGGVVPHMPQDLHEQRLFGECFFLRLLSSCARYPLGVHAIQRLDRRGAAYLPLADGRFMVLQPPEFWPYPYSGNLLIRVRE